MYQATDIVRKAATLIGQYGEEALAHARAQVGVSGIVTPAALDWRRIVDALVVIGDFETDQNKRVA